MATASSVNLRSGLTLSYARQGNVRDVALVLLPGPTDSWRSYQPVLDRLPRSMYTVAVSLRGHGDSDKPKTGYRVEDYAVDVVSLLDALGIERAVLAGHSGSCLVARRVALDRPERVGAWCSKPRRRPFAAMPDSRSSCSQSFPVWRIRSAQTWPALS